MGAPHPHPCHPWPRAHNCPLRSVASPSLGTPPRACLGPGLILGDGTELPLLRGKLDLGSSSVCPALGRGLGAWRVLPSQSPSGDKRRGTLPGGAKSKEEVTPISQPESGGAPSGPSHPTVPGATTQGIFRPQARMGDPQDAKRRTWGRRVSHEECGSHL